MKISLFVILSCIVLTGCVSYGDTFFIRNHEENAVVVSYKYLPANDIQDAPDYEPYAHVLIADSVLDRKFLKKVPYYQTMSSFDSLKVKGLQYGAQSFELAGKSTAYIRPIFMYGANLEYLVVNAVDTVKFMQEYPYVEEEEFRSRKLFVRKGPFWSSQYTIFDLDIPAIQEILYE